MGFLRSVVVVAALCVGSVAQADYARLFDVAGINAMISTMAQEGQAYGDEMAEDFFDGTAPASWQPAVDVFYNADAMQKIMLEEFTKAAGDAEFSGLLSFYQSDLGQKVIGLETTGRLAMIDPEIEEMAKAAYEAANPDTARIGAITDIITGLDLIEGNVSGSMNSNIAFYRGLASLPGVYELTEMEILDEVRGQEASIRDNSKTWLYSYYLFSLSPLEVSEIVAYGAVLTSDEGLDFNRALFAAFDVLYDRIMFGLGHTIASASNQQEL